MDLSHEEQVLVENFRKLQAEGRRELLDYASFLRNRPRPAAAEAPADRCSLPDHDERPEAAKEPLVTE